MTSEFNQNLFAYRLRIKQQALHLSVTTAAKEIGITKATLSRLNREKTIPDVITYAKCCIWLKLSLDYFFENHK